MTKVLSVKQLIKRSVPITVKQQVRFFKALSDLLGAGYSIQRSLAALALAYPAWQTLITDLEQRLSRGDSVDQAFSNWRLSRRVVFQLETASAHGQLEPALQVVGQQLEHSHRQKTRLKQVLRYPVGLLAAIVVLAVASHYYLIPMLLPQQSTTTSVPKYGSLIALAGVLFLCAGGVFWRRLSPLRRLKALARLPLVGGLTRLLVTYHVTEQLALLLAVGLPLPTIVTSLAVTEDDLGYGVAIARASQLHLAAGNDLASYVAANVFLDPRLAGYFQSGVAPDVMADNLKHYARLQFDELNQKIGRWVALVQPLCFLIVGAAIVCLYLSILLPMYQSLGGLSES